MAGVTATRRGACSVLELALPGREPEPAGVILHDPGTGRLGVRLRRDWREIAPEDEAEVLELIEDDLRAKAAEMGPETFVAHLEDTLSNTLRISDRETVLLGDFERTLNRLYNDRVRATVLPFETHLPVYSCGAAAGKFGENMAVEPEGWVEAPLHLRLHDKMFVATVTGRSMEPVIPDGARCIFRAGVAGTRQGKLVLVENREESEAGGERYTVKRYRSFKRVEGDSWRHEKIVMEPLNPEFEAWEIDPESAEAEKVRVVAEFVCVLY